MHIDNNPVRHRSLWPVTPGKRVLQAIQRHFRFGTLSVTLPNGTTEVLRGTECPGQSAELKLNDYGVLRALIWRGPIALGETYWEGRWQTNDLKQLLCILAHNEQHLRHLLPRITPARWIDRLTHRRRRNTRSQAARNIHAHYDLGNAFYEAWLDDSMTYSAARYAPEAEREPLSAAQRRKYLELAQATDIQPGHHVLEVGCGWGGFAEFAARELDCRVLGITISREQYAFAKARIVEAGLADRAEIRYCDYRDLAQQIQADGLEGFDRVISIEMFEAVGEEFWQTYAETVLNLLKPGGRAGLQVITIDEARFEGYRRHPDFIQRYVFPGGMLPSVERLCDLFRAAGAPRAECVKTFGADYAATLADWQARFNAEWSRIRPLGFDERFRRFWNYYLSHCQAGFSLGWTDVGHFVIQRA